MTHALRFTISYKRLSNNTTNIKIYQSGWTGGTTELIPDGNPLSITFNGSESNIFEPTNGSGASIKIMGDPLSMLDLYTDDPQEFIVKIYNDTTLIWQGYISTEIYSEDYSTSSDLLTPIIIECNDGMGLLDNIPYTELNRTPYTGITSIAGVIQTICGKLENKYTSLTLVSDYMLSSTGYTNIFIGLNVNNENYYDEETNPVSCREVLNKILQGLGLVMEFSGDKIIVFDPIQLKKPTIAKSYSLYSGYSFNETNTTLGGFKLINTEIPWYKTGQNLDMSKAFNQIDVDYDPYSFTESGYDFSDGDNTLGIPTWVTGGTGDYRLSEDVALDGWIIGNTDSYFNGISQITVNESIADKIGPPVYYFNTRYNRGEEFDQTKYVEYEFPSSIIKQDNGLYLELSTNVYVSTINDDNIITPDLSTAIILSYGTAGRFEFSIGDNWYNPSDGQWYNTPKPFSISVRQSDADYRTDKVTIPPPINIRSYPGSRVSKTYDVKISDSRINDTWTQSITTIDISDAATANIGLLQGTIKLKMYKDNFEPVFYSESGFTISSNFVEDFNINNISIRVLDRNKLPISNSGVVIKAYLDSTEDFIKKSELKISLKNGTGKYGTSRGAYSSPISDPYGTNITGLYRSGSTESHSTNWYVAQQLISQYQKPRKKISASFDVKDLLLDLKYKIINDIYLPGIDMYLVNGTYDDRNESMSCNILEIVSEYDELPNVTPTPTPPVPPTPTPTPTSGQVLIGFDSAGDIDFTRLGNSGNTISLEIKFTATGYQDWFNCTPVPSGIADLTYVIDAVNKKVKSIQIDASESDPSPSTIDTLTHTFTSITSGSTATITNSLTTNYREYCGDGWGVIEMEILTLTITGGDVGDDIIIDPSNYYYRIN